MAVLQEKSIIEAIETLTSNSQQSELYVGQHFISWPSAIAYVSEWCNLQGFQSRLDRSDRNNNMPAGEYRKLAIVCQHSGKYKKPLAELSLNNNIKENHKTIAKVSKTIRLGCKAHINLSRPEKNNVNQYVFVTTIVNEHCHELNSQLINYTKETALTREMIEDIKFLTLQVRLTITQQRVYLEKKYPERKIQSDILRYEIQKYRPSAKELNRDALNLYEHLLKLKEDDIRWQIFVNFDETKCTLLATGGKKQSNETISGGLVPLVFMTDADPALFTILIEKYEQAAEYLRNLYKTKTYWAL
ncbi:15344_t:CDS:2, partial [Rhizophagus irregularis]